MEKFIVVHGVQRFQPHSNGEGKTGWPRPWQRKRSPPSTVNQDADPGLIQKSVIPKDPHAARLQFSILLFPWAGAEAFKIWANGDISKHSKISLGLILTSFGWVLASTSFEVMTLLSLVLRYLLFSSSNSFHSWLATGHFSGDVLSCSHFQFYPWGLLSILDLGAVRFIFLFFLKILSNY